MKLVLVLCLAASAASAAPSAGIRVNQTGFAPLSEKIAVVPDGAADSFEVIEAASGQTVLRAALGAPAVWKPSKESVRLADFSALSAPGNYRIRIAGLPQSDTFAVGAQPNRSLNSAAL